MNNGADSSLRVAESFREIGFARVMWWRKIGHDFFPLGNDDTFALGQPPLDFRKGGAKLADGCGSHDVNHT